MKIVNLKKPMSGTVLKRDAFGCFHVVWASSYKEHIHHYKVRRRSYLKDGKTVEYLEFIR
jgi:hypothetical protein